MRKAIKRNGKGEKGDGGDSYEEGGKEMGVRKRNIKAEIGIGRNMKKDYE
jgi:hypothetical protein